VKKKVKHFRFSEKDQRNLSYIKKQFDCMSENEAARIALRLAAMEEN